MRRLIGRRTVISFRFCIRGRQSWEGSSMYVGRHEVNDRSTRPSSPYFLFLWSVNNWRFNYHRGRSYCSARTLNITLNARGLNPKHMDNLRNKRTIFPKGLQHAKRNSSAAHIHPAMPMMNLLSDTNSRSLVAQYSTSTYPLNTVKYYQ